MKFETFFLQLVELCFHPTIPTFLKQIPIKVNYFLAFALPNKLPQIPKALLSQEIIPNNQTIEPLQPLQPLQQQFQTSISQTILAQLQTLQIRIPFQNRDHYLQPLITQICPIQIYDLTLPQFCPIDHVPKLGIDIQIFSNQIAIPRILTPQGLLPYQAHFFYFSHQACRVNNGLMPFPMV